MDKQEKKKTGEAKWSGSLGFIMAAAGSAVGMGNLWRFPMLVGENGGGAFVLIYLICIVLVGIPMIIAEVTIGRAGGKDAFGRGEDRRMGAGSGKCAGSLHDLDGKGK